MKNLPLLIAFLFISSIVYAQNFEEQSVQLGINHTQNARGLMGGGAAFFDYQNDGDQDLYITGGFDKDSFYQNNGDGTFTKINADIGINITAQNVTTGVTTGDIDNDGDRDIFATTWSNSGTNENVRNFLFLNNGDGSFTEIGETAGITDAAFSIGASFLDFNRDGFLDIYVINHIENPAFLYDSTGVIAGFDHECFPNFLYKNNGDNTFTEVSANYGMDQRACGLASIPTDYDSDGDMDILIANDFGPFLTPNELYQNNYPQENFSEVGASTGADFAIYGMGFAAGDYDHDQDLDYYITNLGANVLMENTAGTFVDMAQSAGVENTFANGSEYSTGWGTAFLDVDNDGWEDLYVCNGRIPSLSTLPTAFNDPNKLYLNNGDKTFTDISVDAGVNNENYGRGMAYADFDNDGDLDILIINLNELGGTSKFYVNQTDNSNNYIQLKLVGKESNKDGYGSKVWLFANGETYLRELGGGGASHVSQHSSILHFGLGALSEIDSVRIEWTNGHVDHLEALAINQLHTIEEGIISSIKNTTTDLVNIKVSPNPFKDYINIKAKEFENLPVEIRLLTVAGLPIVETTVFFTHNFSLPISENMAPGIYILSIASEKGNALKKVIKLK